MSINYALPITSVGVDRNAVAPQKPAAGARKLQPSNDKSHYISEQIYRSRMILHPNGVSS